MKVWMVSPNEPPDNWYQLIEGIFGFNNCLVHYDLAYDKVYIVDEWDAEWFLGKEELKDMWEQLWETEGLRKENPEYKYSDAEFEDIYSKHDYIKKGGDI